LITGIHCLGRCGRDERRTLSSILRSIAGVGANRSPLTNHQGLATHSLLAPVTRKRNGSPAFTSGGPFLTFWLPSPTMMNAAERKLSTNPLRPGALPRVGSFAFFQRTARCPLRHEASHQCPPKSGARSRSRAARACRRRSGRFPPTARLPKKQVVAVE
jgi:hypothetical protein